MPRRRKTQMRASKTTARGAGIQAIAALALGALLVAVVVTRRGRSPFAASAPTATASPAPAGQQQVTSAASPTAPPGPDASSLSPAPTSDQQGAAAPEGPPVRLRGLDGEEITSQTLQGRVAVLFFIVPG